MQGQVVSAVSGKRGHGGLASYQNLPGRTLCGLSDSRLSRNYPTARYLKSDKSRVCWPDFLAKFKTFWIMNLIIKLKRFIIYLFKKQIMNSTAHWEDY